MCCMCALLILFALYKVEKPALELSCILSFRQRKEVLSTNNFSKLDIATIHVKWNTLLYNSPRSDWRNAGSGVHVWYTLDLFFSSFSSFIQLVHNLANSDSTGSLKERLLSVISSSSPPLIVQKLAAMIAVSKGTLCQLTQTCNLAQPISDILLNSLFTGPFHIFISFPQTQLQQSMSSVSAQCSGGRDSAVFLAGHFLLNTIMD